MDRYFAEFTRLAVLSANSDHGDAVAYDEVATCERHDVFIACNRIDSIDRAHTTMLLSKGLRWRPARDIAWRRPEETPPGFDLNAEPKLVFNNAQIGGRHAWSDMFLPLYGPFLSDALAKALRAERFAGIALGKQESV